MAALGRVGSDTPLPHGSLDSRTRGSSSDRECTRRRSP